ncbi:MAG: hypothetical protein Q4E55_06025 [Bacteroidales bacterium]|nr:hypothetical protein [Bacteroidales bacterium]
MLGTLGSAMLVVAGCVAMLCIGIVFKGKFPSMHVGGNKALQQRGIHCVQAQDREARNRKGLMK